MTVVCLVGLLAVGAVGAQAHSFIAGFSPTTLATTAPTNGDVNPYGIVTVPRSVGALKRGDVLVSNFNGSGNAQERARPSCSSLPAIWIRTLGTRRCSRRSTRTRCRDRAPAESVCLRRLRSRRAGS